MNTPPTRPLSAGPSALSRRFKAGFFALVMLLAVTLSVVLVNAIAPRVSRRYDVTSTGEHKLAPRTENMLASLKNQFRVVLAGDFSRVDARARERVDDVLEQFARHSPNVSIRTINAGTAAGQEEFDRLIAELAQDNRAELESQRATIEAAAQGGATLAQFLEQRLSPAFEGVRASLTPAPSEPASARFQQAADYFRDLAAAARIGAQDLRQASTAITEPLNAKVRSTPVPATDLAAAALRGSLSPSIDQLSLLRARLQQMLQTDSINAKAKDLLGPVIAAIAAARDEAAVHLDSLVKLKRPDIRRVADVLSRGNAALVVGPPSAGLSAIEFEMLFPPTEWLDSTQIARADVGRRAEELFSSALNSLESPIKPIVVVVHAEARAFFDLNRFLTRVRERLALRGIDVVEWATVIQDTPPGLALLNADRTRPVVYVSLTPNTAVGTGAGGEKPGVERAKHLGQVLTALADAGESLLISMSPSALAAYNQPDPTVGVLDRFGIKADTARPLMHETLTQRGRVVTSDLTAQPIVRATLGSTHPIAAAVTGLPLAIEWPITMSVTPSETTVATPLYTAVQDGGTWGESQWAAMWATHGQIDRESDLPTFDQARDVKLPEWLVAVAAERRTPSGTPQRMVAVGANTWFMDERSQAVRVDGRVADASPGNLELFESSVYWLARQDSLIAQSPEARAVALVKPITAAQVKLIRWLVIAGLPLLVLIVGGLYRWIRD